MAQVLMKQKYEADAFEREQELREVGVLARTGGELTK